MSIVIGVFAINSHISIHAINHLYFCIFLWSLTVGVRERRRWRWGIKWYGECGLLPRPL